MWIVYFKGLPETWVNVGTEQEAKTVVEESKGALEYKHV